MVNLSDLKAKEIRKSIDVNINGDIQEIVVFSATQEVKDKLKAKIGELEKQELDRDVFLSELLTDIITECTNIVVDEDMIEVLNNPTGDMLIVLHEVLSIIHDIEIEISLETYQQLCHMESIEYAKLNLLKAEQVQLINEDSKRVEKEINKVKKPVKKTTKKSTKK